MPMTNKSRRMQPLGLKMLTAELSKKRFSCFWGSEWFEMRYIIYLVKQIDSIQGYPGEMCVGEAKRFRLQCGCSERCTYTRCCLVDRNQPGRASPISKRHGHLLES